MCSYLPYYSWEFIWSYLMESTFARSWLFNGERPTSTEITKTFKNDPVLLGLVMQFEDERLRAFKVPELVELCTTIASNEDTVLGLCFGFNGKSMAFSYMNTYEQALEEDEQTTLTVRRCCWRRICDDNMNPCMLFIEFGWAVSGALYVRTEVRHGDSSPNFIDSRNSHYDHSEFRVFSSSIAKSLIYTSSSVDQIIQNHKHNNNQHQIQSITDLNHNFQKQLNYLFYPSYKGLVFTVKETLSNSSRFPQYNDASIVSKYTQGLKYTVDMKSVINTRKKNSPQNVNLDIWNRMSDSISRCKKIGSRLVSVRLKGFDDQTKLVCRNGFPPEYVINYTLTAMTRIKVIGKLQQICSMLGIRDSAPTIDEPLFSKENNENRNFEQNKVHQQHIPEEKNFGCQNENPCGVNQNDVRNNDLSDNGKNNSSDDTNTNTMINNSHTNSTITTNAITTTSSTTTNNNNKYNDDGKYINKNNYNNDNNRNIATTSNFTITNYNKYYYYYTINENNRSNNSNADDYNNSYSDSDSDSDSDINNDSNNSDKNENKNIHKNINNNGNASNSTKDSSSNTQSRCEIISTENDNCESNSKRVQSLEQSLGKTITSSSNTNALYPIGQIVKTNRNVQEVSNLHHPIKENEWCCGFCGKTVRGKRTNLTRHIKTIHFKSFPYSCDVSGCTRKFQSRGNLQRHKLTVHYGRTFACHSCPRRFQTSNSLSIHVSSAHQRNTNTMRCPKCGGKYSRDSAVRRHALTCRGIQNHLTPEDDISPSTSQGQSRKDSNVAQ